MKRLFVTGDLTSFANRGQRVIPQIIDAAPITLALGARSRRALGRRGAGSRRGRRGIPRCFARQRVDGACTLIPVCRCRSSGSARVMNLLSQSRLHDTHHCSSWVPSLGYKPLSRWLRALVQDAHHPVVHPGGALYRDLCQGSAR